MRFTRSLGTASILAMVALTPSFVGATQPPSPPANAVGITTSIPLPSNVEDAQFTTAAGTMRTIRSLKGVTILVPMLTLCADVCPFTTGNLLQLAAHLHAKRATGVQIVALSVDPNRDSTKRLASYVKRLGVSPQSQLLQFWRGNAASTSTVMKFFGMRADRLSVDSPAPKDWMTGKPLAYDIDHSDGFFVLNGQHTVKFISGLAPRFVGTLASALKSYLSEDGLSTLAHPGSGWTPSDALQALSYVARRPL